jgi:class III poly(R)-hydroxyalkanoic acid synthase PhaE subunit
MSDRDPADVYRQLFESWRGVMPTGDWARTLERTFATQAAVAKTVELCLDAWRDLAATPPGPAWTEKLQRHAERIQRQATSSSEAAAKAHPSRLWTDYLEYVSSLGLPGWKPPQKASASAGADLAGLAFDAYEAAFGRSTGAPIFGPGRELNEKLRRAFEAWGDWVQAGAAYGEIVADTWRRAIERFLEQLAGIEAPSLRSLTTRFMEVAETVLVERFGQQDYIEAQARALEAGLRYRAAEQELADVVLRQGHVPTRSEVDGAHRRVYELKQEVRALREELRRLREETRAARAAAESEPAGAGEEEGA